MESMRWKTAGHDLYFFYGHPRSKKYGSLSVMGCNEERQKNQ
jgi:hypothetical protein